MIKNYFKIAWRNLLRHKAYSAINIAGLTVGIASALLIFTAVNYELSYDTFQKNYDNVYRIVTKTKNGDGTEGHNPGIPTPAYEALKTDFPQIEKIAAVAASGNKQITILGNDPNSDIALSKKFIEPANMAFTQPEYFDIFNAKWIAGTAKVLSQPGNAVIDKPLAIKYFGDWKNAMGQYVKMDNSILLKVSGIIEEAPANSDFPIKFFASYETLKNNPGNYGYYPGWGSLSSNHQIYITLPKNVAVADIQAQMKGFVKKHFKEGRPDERMQVLQPLKEIHFDSRYGGLGDHSTSKNILWTLSFIAVLIIVMASINFINLSTAQSVGRSKEVGIRKVLGSSRKQLVGQVMGETFLIVLFSLFAAIGLAKIALPYLSHIASVPANLPLLTVESILFLTIVLMVVTLLSGIYPAMIVSGFKPALALKSKISSANIGGISLRRILVVTQFSISQILIIGTIVAVTQMNFVRNADLGFNKEAILVMPAYSDSVNLLRMKPLKQQLLKNPEIVSVSFASDEASSDNNWASNFAFDNKKDEEYAVFHKYGDEDYVKTFGLDIIAGKAYSASDTMREIMINETLAKKLGLKDPEQAIGKMLRIGGGQWLPVVGVVKDFKTNSLREDVKPLTVAPRQDFYYTMAVKLRTANLPQTIAQIQKQWEKTYPEYAFDSHFVDETIERFYKQETQLALLYKIFAAIAIFISCLGLYGLVSFMAAQKTKEVGIRKVLGADVRSIVVMFSKEFTLLISIAFIIAVPVAWYFMNGWLQNFVYRIHIGAGVFVLAILTSLVIAWITVGYRAVKAALANPVQSLRTE
jgi:putative ABC transport system permease protein